MSIFLLYPEWKQPLEFNPEGKSINDIRQNTVQLYNIRKEKVTTYDKELMSFINYRIEENRKCIIELMDLITEIKEAYKTSWLDRLLKFIKSPSSLLSF